MVLTRSQCQQIKREKRSPSWWCQPIWKILVIFLTIADNCLSEYLGRKGKHKWSVTKQQLNRCVPTFTCHSLVNGQKKQWEGQKQQIQTDQPTGCTGFTGTSSIGVVLVVVCWVTLWRTIIDNKFHVWHCTAFRFQVAGAQTRWCHALDRSDHWAQKGVVCPLVNRLSLHWLA